MHYKPLPEKSNLENEQLLELSFQIIEKIAAFQKFRNFCSPEFYEDLKQDLQIYFITETQKIITGFKGNSSLKTYLTSVFFRQSNNILKKNHYLNIPEKLKIDNTEHVGSNVGNDFDYKYIFTLVKLILNSDPLNTYKLSLMMKMDYRIKLELPDDYFNAFPDSSDLDYELFQKKYFSTDTATTLNEMIEIYRLSLNANQSKHNSFESVQRWYYRATNNCISLLNRLLIDANFSRETFQLLIEKYYSFKESQF